jgi:hypothetical protein
MEGDMKQKKTRKNKDRRIEGRKNESKHKIKRNAGNEKEWKS